MSKWTDIRDNALDALHVDEVTEEVKQGVTRKILDEVIPVVESAVDAFCATTKEQAKAESGWCKIRDAIVLPLVLQGCVYIVKTVLSKTVVQTVQH